MRPALLAALAFSLAACGGGSGAIRPGEPAASVPTGMPMIPATPPVAIPDDADLIVSVSEAVGDPEKDYASYTKVYVDNAAAGQTQIEAKSKEKRWGAKVGAGNHLVRLETWILPPSGDWQMLDPQWQPAERFFRVFDGKRTIVTLKLYDGGLKHELKASREALAP